MIDAVRFAQLSEPRPALIRLCQIANYGWLQKLSLRDSDPVFNATPVGIAR